MLKTFVGFGLKKKHVEMVVKMIDYPNKVIINSYIGMHVVIKLALNGWEVGLF